LSTKDDQLPHSQLVLLFKMWDIILQN